MHAFESQQLFCMRWAIVNLILMNDNSDDWTQIWRSWGIQLSNRSWTVVPSTIAFYVCSWWSSCIGAHFNWFQSRKINHERWVYKTNWNTLHHLERNGWMKTVFPTVRNSYLFFLFLKIRLAWSTAEKVANRKRLKGNI